MTIKALVKELCRREGLKKQMDVAQVTELVGHLSDLIFEEYGVETGMLNYAMLMNGARRAKRRKAGK